MEKHERYQSEAEELAISYFNGNISSVREAIEDDGVLALEVSDYIRGMYGQKEWDTFVRIMTS